MSVPLYCLVTAEELHPLLPLGSGRQSACLKIVPGQWQKEVSTLGYFFSPQKQKLRHMERLGT